MDWDPKDLVTWEGAKLLSRPDLTIKQIKGIKTPQRIGDGSFFIEHVGKTYRVTVGAHYWDEAAKQFGGVQKGLKKDDLVDITLGPYHWTVKGYSGIKYYFYEIKETNSNA